MTDPNLTHITIVADRSGSMSPIAADMNGGIRQFLADQAAQPGTVTVDITTFDTRVERPYVGVAPADVKDDIIVPRGMTALNDAIGTSIVLLGERLAAMTEDDRPGTVIFVVVTDGAENSSVEYTTEQVRDMVTEQADRWGWQFVYLAANVDAFATGSAYGFGAGQTMNYAATGDGTKSALSTASSVVTRMRSGGASDITDAEREAAK